MSAISKTVCDQILIQSDRQLTYNASSALYTVPPELAKMRLYSQQLPFNESLKNQITIIQKKLDTCQEEWVNFLIKKILSFINGETKNTKKPRGDISAMMVDYRMQLHQLSELVTSEKAQKQIKNAERLLNSLETQKTLEENIPLSFPILIHQEDSYSMLLAFIDMIHPPKSSEKDPLYVKKAFQNQDGYSVTAQERIRALQRAHLELLLSSLEMQIIAQNTQEQKQCIQKLKDLLDVLDPLDSIEGFNIRDLTDKAHSESLEIIQAARDKMTIAWQLP